jgi:hypothetical protein
MTMDAEDNAGGPGSSVEPLIAQVVAPVIHLHNGDDLRRFYELGEGPRDIHHYRKLTGKPRSTGVLMSYPMGTTLHLEAAPSPGIPDDELWLVLIDTSIGLPWTGWRELEQRGLVTLEMADAVEGRREREPGTIAR